VNSDAKLIAITGLSNAGKTSLLRAAVAATCFDPMYPTTGADVCEVEIEFDDITIKRECTYKWKDGEAVKQSDKLKAGDKPWTKCNRELPEGFKELTGISKLDIDGDGTYFYINFSKQVDALLPIQYKPSQLAKLFATVSGRNRLDNAIRETNTAIKAVQKDINNINEQLDKQLESQKTLRNTIPNIDDDLATLPNMLNALDAATKFANEYKVLCASLEEVRDNRQFIDIAIATANSIFSEVSKMMDDVKHVSTIKKELGDIVIPTLHPTTDRTEDIDRLSKLIEEHAKLSKLSNEYKQIVLQCAVVVRSITTTDNDIAVVTKSIAKLFNDNNNLCPYSCLEIPEDCKRALQGG